MRTLLVITLAALLITAAGCGVNKQYVADEIAASEARMEAQISNVEDQAESNQKSIEDLQALASELENKTDMALNKASGFENYEVIWSGTINFAFDRYNIDDVAASILDEAGMKLEEVPSSLLEISGHCDRTGSVEYNLWLGEKRANEAQRYLANKFGISLYRMFILSQGEEKPVAMADEMNAASKNRRVELAVWGPGM